MKKTTKILAGSVAVAIGGLAMTGMVSAYSIEYHPEANVSYTLNSGFDTKRDFTAGLITITDGTETYTIMDRNLGATSTGVDSSDSYGYYFQWGNNYGFPTAGSVATSRTKVDASGYGPGNYYSSSTFIKNTPWHSSANDNLRGGVSGTYEAMQGPCPEGYHVPSSGEWLGLSTMLGYDGTPNSNASIQAANSLRNELYLPFAGYRSYLSAGVSYQGTGAHYWSSTAKSANYAYYQLFGSSGLYPQIQDGRYRSEGFSVRCFKNSPYSASDLPSEDGDSEIVVRVGKFNNGQNTCTGQDFIFSGIFASPATVTRNIVKTFQCAFGDMGQKAVTLQLSGDLTDGNGNTIPASKVRLKNSAWVGTPAGVQSGVVETTTYTPLNQTITLFNKIANKIGIAEGTGVDIQIEIPGGTPNGTYNGVLILSY